MIALAGSRNVTSPAARPLLLSLGRQLERMGQPVAIGDCRGVDALAIKEFRALSLPLHLLSVGAATGKGFWPGSVPLNTLKAAQDAGLPVYWWAGGQCHCRKVCHCLRRRLLGRTLSMVRATAMHEGPKNGIIGIFQHNGSRGTWQALRAAAGRGVPVVAYCLGFDPATLPPLAPGARWVEKSCDIGTVRRALWQPIPPTPPEKVEAWRAARHERAEREGDRYEWDRVAPGHRSQIEAWSGHNPVSGGTYRVTAEGCSCPDYQYRASKVELACKHMLALARYLRWLESEETRADEPLAA